MIKTDHKSNTQAPYSSKKKVGYILGRFPSLTKIFIDREIIEIKNKGLPIFIIAVRSPFKSEISAGVHHVDERAKYILPINWLYFLKYNLYFILTRPWAYLSTLCYFLTRRYDRFVIWAKVPIYFIEGIVAAAMLRAEQVDHIHAHFADRSAIVAMIASRLLNVPYSVTAHAADIYVNPIILREKIIHAKFVTTCTAYNKVHLEHIAGCPIELVYHGLDINEITPAASSQLKKDRPLIFAVGSLREKKGFIYLIKACRILKDQGYDFICEIVGQGPQQKELEQLIADLRLQDVILLRGALLNAEVMSMYAQADLFVHPGIIAENSDRDGIPNVILEAMATGVPVIATRLSGIPEVVDSGVTGMLVDSGDEGALADVMMKLLNNPDLQEYLAKNGRRLIEEKFDIQVNIDRLIKLFET